MTTVDCSHLFTAEDIAAERVKLMGWREHMERVDGGLGFRSHRVFAGLVEVAITSRAIELELEDHR